MPARWLFAFLPLSCCHWGRAALLWAALLGPGWAAAQYREVLPFRFEKPRQQQLKMPFQLQRNLMVVPVELNGQGPFNFLLDTGLSLSLLTDPALIAPLRLRRGSTYAVMGAGEDAPLEAFLTDSVQLKMPGIVAPDLRFVVLSSDVLNLSSYVGMPIHGILGYDFFRSFVVEIEPTQLYLRLHAPAGYRPPRGRRWAALPLALEGQKAYLTVPVALTDSLTRPLKLVLDTGAGHALSLETSSDPQLRIPPERLRAQLGLGLNGTINGYLGRVRGMQLGRYRLQSLLTSYPDADNGALRTDVPRNGNIGLELLKRFVLVIDYPHNKLWLRPNGLFRDPFEHDMCGLELLATGPDYHRYLILRIQAGSPAAAAGLLPDDELLSVNLLPTGNLSITQLSRFFHSQDGRVLLLLVRRPNGELFTTTVRLKRQI